MHFHLKNLALLVAAFTLAACTSIGSRPIFSDDAGALRGYDPIAYFDENRALKGDENIHYNYGGATFYFTSEDNRRRFKAIPDAFLPQYGGYCAYGMSRNFVVSSDPQAFTLVAGKLYLNYSLKVRDTWLKDVPGNIARADANWQKKLASGENNAE